MIKRIVTPDNNFLSLLVPVPNNYVGKKVEVLLYIQDELMEEIIKPKAKPSDFFGTLSNEDGLKMHEYVNNTRNQWNRNI